MVEVKNPEKLSKEDLIDALVYTNTSGYESNKQIADLHKYYSLLSVEELLEKIDGPLFKEDKGPIVSSLEQKKREHEQNKIKNHRCINYIITENYNHPPHRLNADDSLVLRLRWAHDIEACDVISEGIIGVKCDESYRPRVQRIVDELNYKGQVIYG